MLGSVACRVTSKIIVIGAAERYWGDVKTIKFSNISAIIIYVSEKQIIFYISDCIGSGRIAKSESDYNVDDMSGMMMTRLLVISWENGALKILCEIK